MLLVTEAATGRKFQARAVAAIDGGPSGRATSAELELLPQRQPVQPAPIVVGQLYGLHGDEWAPLAERRLPRAAGCVRMAGLRCFSFLSPREAEGAVRAAQPALWARSGPDVLVAGLDVEILTVASSVLGLRPGRRLFESFPGVELTPVWDGHTAVWSWAPSPTRRLP